MVKMYIDINSNEIEGFEIDLLELESRCSVLQICESFLRMEEVENNIFIGSYKVDGEVQEIRVNAKENTVYINYVLMPIKDLISIFTDEDEVTFLEKCFDLERSDFACSAYLKNKTIVFKDKNGKWFKFC